jgi:hypothetical protein
MEVKDFRPVNDRDLVPLSVEEVVDRTKYG